MLVPNSERIKLAEIKRLLQDNQAVVELGPTAYRVKERQIRQL